MSNAMIFLGYFLNQSVQSGSFDWASMLPCALVAVAAAVWSTWLFVSIQLGNEAMTRDLFETKDKLEKALRKPALPRTVVSASAAPQSRNGRQGWRPS
jgi:hypothetical protein